MLSVTNPVGSFIYSTSFICEISVWNFSLMLPNWPTNTYNLIVDKLIYQFIVYHLDMPIAVQKSWTYLVFQLATQDADL